MTLAFVNRLPGNQPCTSDSILKPPLRPEVSHHRAAYHEDEGRTAEHGPVEEDRKQEEQTRRPRDDRTEQCPLSRSLLSGMGHHCDVQGAQDESPSKRPYPQITLPQRGEWAITTL